MNDCITTTKQSTTKPCAYFLGYTVALAGAEETMPANIYINEHYLHSHELQLQAVMIAENLFTKY